MSIMEIMMPTLGRRSNKRPVLRVTTTATLRLLILRLAPRTILTRRRHRGL
jgi:hypothetical protein